MVDCKDINFEELSKELLVIDPDQHINDLAVTAKFARDKLRGGEAGRMAHLRKQIAKEMWR